MECDGKFCPALDGHMLDGRRRIDKAQEVPLPTYEYPSWGTQTIIQLLMGVLWAEGSGGAENRHGTFGFVDGGW